jgi:hypothetical protein
MYTGTKKDFILARPQDLPNEIIDAAKAVGVKITPSIVYAVRSKARRDNEKRKHLKAKAKVAKSLAHPSAANAAPPKETRARYARSRPAARARKTRRPRGPMPQGTLLDLVREASAKRPAMGPGEWDAAMRNAEAAGFIMGSSKAGSSSASSSSEDARAESILFSCAAVLGVSRAIVKLESWRQALVAGLPK